MTNNIACRIFKEQINLINQLPEKERPFVLYLAINSCFNQIEYQNDNQSDNQNENAYVSVSVSESLYLNQLSEISKCVLELLKKNIVCKEFSNNYGGKRDGSGRKGKDKQDLTQDGHTDNKYGELKNVRLTEEQYDSLKEKYPNLDEAIEVLDTWLGTPSKTAKAAREKNHYAYFKSNSWIWERLNPKTPQETNKSEYMDLIMKGL